MKNSIFVTIENFDISRMCHGKLLKIKIYEVIEVVQTWVSYIS